MFCSFQLFTEPFSSSGVEALTNSDRHFCLFCRAGFIFTHGPGFATGAPFFGPAACFMIKPAGAKPSRRIRLPETLCRNTHGTSERRKPNPAAHYPTAMDVICKKRISPK